MTASANFSPSGDPRASHIPVSANFQHKRERESFSHDRFSKITRLAGTRGLLAYPLQQIFSTSGNARASRMTASANFSPSGDPRASHIPASANFQHKRERESFSHDRFSKITRLAGTRGLLAYPLQQIFSTSGNARASRMTASVKSHA